MAEPSQDRYEAFAKCIDKFIQSVQGKPSTLAKCFPSAHKECPEALQLISEQLWSGFSDNLKTHAMSLTSELDLKKLMRELDEEERPRIAWRFSGCPARDAQPALDQILREELKELEEIADKSKQELEELEMKLKEKHSRVGALLQDVEEKVKVLEKVSDDCSRSLHPS